MSLRDRCDTASVASLVVAFEDEWLLVADKPSGLAVHAAQGVAGLDLQALVRAHAPSAMLLHRLDREASGLVLFAKRREASARLQPLFERHEIERSYLAVLAGALAPGQRVVDRPVPERAQGRSAVRGRPPPGALPARSQFTTLRPLDGGATLVEVRLETGRKHQIRVHAAAIGHPILGDRRYGGPAAARLMLHAARLAFAHPADGHPLEVRSLSPFPPEPAGRPGGSASRP
jgi:RluA family pseudouridine synthase